MKTFLYDVSHLILNKIVGNIPIFFVRKFLYQMCYRMKIGRGTYIALGVKFISPWKITIGDNSNINSGSLLDGRTGLSVGNNVDIAWDVYIFTLQHDHDDPDYKTYGSCVKISDRACLCTRSMILPGVIIGEGGVVAAGAVVVKDVKPYTMVAGVPAREKRERSRNQRYNLRKGINL